MTISDDQMKNHLDKDTYGDYQLCGVRPYLNFVPKQGFRHSAYEGVSAVVAAVSKEIILDIFYMMIEALEKEVIVVLESSHKGRIEDNEPKLEAYYGMLDLVILKSILVDYEELMLMDGLFGIAIYSIDADENPIEVQLDEHKLLTGFGYVVDKFDQIFEMYGLVQNEKLDLIGNNNHIHLSSPKYYSQFLELKEKLGVIKE